MEEDFVSDQVRFERNKNGLFDLEISVRVHLCTEKMVADDGGFAEEPASAVRLFPSRA